MCGGWCKERNRWGKKWNIMIKKENESEVGES